MENNEILPLNEWQLEEQLESVIDFLRSVHPTLNNEDGFRPCVELRPINRGEKNYLLTRSFMLWDLSDRTINLLREFLARHNGKPTCLFYSVFGFDNQLKAKTTKEKVAKPGKITSASALCTNEIALDFDNIDFDGYVEIVERFEAMGIYALWVSSGHGFQAHILLDKALHDKDTLKRFVYLFRAKGFRCDTSCTDPARLMRLPGTFNNKCFSDDAYEDERDDPPACEVVQYSVHRYSIDFLLEQLHKLPSVSEHDAKQYEDLLKHQEKVSEKSSESQNNDTSDEDMVSVSRIEYPYLSKYEVPSAVSKMLAYTPHGYRNKVLGFLIKFLKLQFKLGKEQILDILEIWAKDACDPIYQKSEFRSDFNRLYFKYKGLGYDSDLAQKFGVIDFQELIELRKQDIVIPRKFFEELDQLDGKVVRLFLAIKMLEHVDEPVTQERLTSMLGISDRALRPTLQDLIKSGHAYMTKGKPRLKIPNTYHTHRGYSQQEGFMPFSYNDIKAYLTELFEDGARGNGCLKLYLFMRWKFYSGEVFMSQGKLGQFIGASRTSVSDLVYRLQDKHFLKIRKVHSNTCFDRCEYTLLR